MNTRTWPRRSFWGKGHRARAVDTVQSKDVLGGIEADGADLVHGRLLEWALTPPLWHAEAVGGVHTIKPRTLAHPATERAATTSAPISAVRVMPLPRVPLHPSAAETVRQANPFATLTSISEAAGVVNEQGLRGQIHWGTTVVWTALTSLKL